MEGGIPLGHLTPYSHKDINYNGLVLSEIQVKLSMTKKGIIGILYIFTTI